MTAAYANIADHPDTISDAELWAAVDLDRPSLDGVREAVQREDWAAAAEAWAAYFRSREAPTMHFRRDRWPDWVREHRPQLVAPILAE
ncbi:MAG: heparinase II/III family protein, partial [Armatimonadota bacterium]